MNGELLMTALQGIDDKYVEEASDIQKGKQLMAIKITAVICACLAVIIFVLPFVKSDDLPMISGDAAASHLRIMYSNDYDDPEPYYDRTEMGSYVMTDALGKAFESFPEDCVLAVVITDANGGNVLENVLIPFVKRGNDIMKANNVNGDGFGFGFAPTVILLPKRLLFLLDELECPDDMALVLSWGTKN